MNYPIHLLQASSQGTPTGGSWWVLTSPYILETPVLSSEFSSTVHQQRLSPKRIHLGRLLQAGPFEHLVGLEEVVAFRRWDSPQGGIPDISL